MSYAELWHSMGLFAKGVVVTMLIMSLWSWTVTITKWFALWKAQRATRQFTPQFSPAPSPPSRMPAGQDAACLCVWLSGRVARPGTL